MKKVYKPLWSFDILKTEQWLSDMALQGFHLVTFNRLSRCFSFEEGVPQQVTYRIGFEKGHNTLPSTLSNGGWKKIVQRGGWSITTNEQSTSTIDLFPDREGIIQRNQMMNYLFSGILMYLAFITFLQIVMFIIPLSEETTSNNFDWIYSGLSLLTIGGCASFAGYARYKLKKVSKSLSYKQPSITPSPPNKANVRTKFKLDWTLAPDKLEHWLETMEADGYHLHKVNKRGRVFHFIKGTPRTISYCVDYRPSSNKSYFDIHRDAGWKEIFSSNTILEKWSIWRCEYNEGEERPYMYDDRNVHISQAKRIAIQHTLYLLPIVAMLFLSLRLPVERIMSNEGINYDFVFTSAFPLLILLNGWNLTKTWLYFNRVRKYYTN